MATRLLKISPELFIGLCKDNPIEPGAEFTISVKDGLPNDAKLTGEAAPFVDRHGILIMKLESKEWDAVEPSSPAYIVRPTWITNWHLEVKE